MLISKMEGQARMVLKHEAKFLIAQSMGTCTYLRYRTQHKVEIQYVNSSDTYEHNIFTYCHT